MCIRDSHYAAADYCEYQRDGPGNTGLYHKYDKYAAHARLGSCGEVYLTADEEHRDADGNHPGKAHGY